MLRVQADEPNAFAELFELLQPKIFGRLFKSMRDRQEAEDLTQDVFFRLYRSRKRYVPKAKFSTWLYHITSNVVRNAIRHRQRHSCLRYSPNKDGEGTGHIDLTSPSARLEQREVAEVVRRAMGELMTRQRTALEMYQFQHCSLTEIARALSMTPEAAKSLLYRARLQMRASLEQFPDPC
jgi:RNA polymerase sigma-70 factor, ECF subfamily